MCVLGFSSPHTVQNTCFSFLSCSIRYILGPVMSMVPCMVGLFIIDFWMPFVSLHIIYFRMFSRNNNRLDYQLFFHTRGAVRPLGWNGLILIVCLSNVLNYLAIINSKKFSYGPRRSSNEISQFRIMVISMLILTAALSRFLSPGSLKLVTNRPLRRVTALCSPLAAILLLAPSIWCRYRHDSMAQVTLGSTMAKCVFLLLFLAVLLVTISRLRFRRITKLVDRALGTKQVIWHRLVTNLCMLAALVMVLLMHDDDPLYISLMVAYDVYAVVAVSFGNLQIPAAVLRVVLALMRLIPQDYYGDDVHPDKEDLGDKTNLAPSLNIFYGTVLGQGVLYLVACVLDIFSFIPRKALARRAGFEGKWGSESISLYHGFVVEKCLERDALAPKKITLSSFAMDLLNSDSPKRQHHGVEVMHNLLQREPTRARLLADLNTSRKTIATLIDILNWTSPRDSATRLLAAKVVAELAKSLLAATVPGTIQSVSTLLDYTNKRKKTGNPLMDTDDEQEAIAHDYLILDGSNNHEGEKDSFPDTANMPETQNHSIQQHDTRRQNPIARCWQWISNCWSSIPNEKSETETDRDDLLPALGMSILDNLACCDHDNCKEISRATSLIPKIVGFTAYYRSNTTYTEIQWKVLMMSSLKLLHRLTSIAGEIGMTPRHKVSKHPFLLRNLAEIMKDSMTSQESRKLVAGILRNLAVDAETRQAIGRVQVIITRLMKEFLTSDVPSSTTADLMLRKIAGKALAVLALDSVNNCFVMLRETRYEFIRELTGMIHVDSYRCVAASLLRSMCLHARPELKDSDLKDLCYTLREVLKRVMDAEGAQLEIFIGLSSQLCKVIPEDFTRELEHGQIRERFIKRLIDALNGHMEPSADFPGIRRVILEQAINMMEYDSHYASCFNDRRMVEVLAMVEETASELENYNMFLGDAGLMEAGEPLSSLVARAKQMLDAVHSTRQPSAHRLPS